MPVEPFYFAHFKKRKRKKPIPLLQSVFHTDDPRLPYWYLNTSAKKTKQYLKIKCYSIRTWAVWLNRKSWAGALELESHSQKRNWTLAPDTEHTGTKQLALWGKTVELSSNNSPRSLQRISSSCHLSELIKRHIGLSSLRQPSWPIGIGGLSVFSLCFFNSVLVFWVQWMGPTNTMCSSQKQLSYSIAFTHYDVCYSNITFSTFIFH